MKKHSTLLNIILVSLQGLCISSAWAQSDPIAIAIQSMEMLPSQTKNLNINFSNPAGHAVFSYQFSLSYDTTYISIDSVETQNSLSEEGFFYYRVEEGTIQVAYASATALDPQGTLLQLRVRSKAKTGPVSVRFDRFSLDEGAFLAVLTPGEIRIEDPPPSLSSDSVVVTLQFPDIYTASPFEATATVGDLFSGFSALDFILEYDPALLIAQEVTIDETLIESAYGGPDSSEVLIRARLDEPGKVYGVIAGTRPITGEGPLFRIQFSSLDRSGASPVFFSQFNLDEGQLKPILVADTVQIRSRVRPGDTSMDSLVTREDALLVIDHVTAALVLEHDALNAAEVSGNGTVSSYDASLILQYAMGLLPCFPVEAGCQGAKQHEGTGQLAWGEPIVAGTGRRVLPLQVLAGSANMTAIDLEIPLGRTEPTSVSIQPHLPADWHWRYSIKDGVLQLSMAGATPLSGATVFDLVMDANAPLAEIGTAPYQLNETTFGRLRPPAFPDQGLTTALHTNYPNPFDRKTTISFILEEATSVKLHIVDVLGRQVTSLVDGFLQAGRHQAVFDGTSLGPGMYFYRLETDNHTFTRRMIKQ